MSSNASLYRSSTFLRSSAVYGSGKETEFSETNNARRAYQTAVDRSSCQVTPARGGGGGIGATTPRASAIRGGGNGGNNNNGSSINTSSRGAFGSPLLSTPPSRLQYALSSHNSSRVEEENGGGGGGGGYNSNNDSRRQQPQPQQPSAVASGGDGFSRTGSMCSDTSSVGSRYRGGRPRSPARLDPAGLPTAGVSSARAAGSPVGKGTVQRHNPQQLSFYSSDVGGGSKNNNNNNSSSRSAGGGGGVLAGGVRRDPQRNESQVHLRSLSGTQNNNGQAGEDSSTLSKSPMTPTTRYGHFPSSGPAAARTASPSAPRARPDLLPAAGVLTPRRGELDSPRCQSPVNHGSSPGGNSPRHVPTTKATFPEQSGRIFGGDSCVSLIFNRSANDASNVGGGRRSDTPERTIRRRLEAPERPNPEGLWVRTRGRNEVVVLGSKARGCPPPDTHDEIDPMRTMRKMIPQPSHLTTAACTPRGDDDDGVEGGHRTPAPAVTGRRQSPHKPHSSVHVPPYRVDQELMSQSGALTAAGGLQHAPEVFMEPFGKEYRHRRHYDPVDSVRDDIRHTHLTPTQSPRTRGTAMIDGKGPHVSHNVLDLTAHTAEELKEPAQRHRFLAGPPAFVPETPRPWGKPVNPKCVNSPTCQSSLTFGTAAHAAMTSMPRSSPSRCGGTTPRGVRRGTYSPFRETRPF